MPDGWEKTGLTDRPTDRWTGPTLPSQVLCLLAADGSAAAALVEQPSGLDAIVTHGRREAVHSMEEAAWALGTLSADGASKRSMILDHLDRTGRPCP